MTAALSPDRRRLSLQVAGSVDEVIKTAARHTVLNLTSHDGDLEDVFLDYYRTGSSS